MTDGLMGLFFLGLFLKRIIYEFQGLDVSDRLTVRPRGGGGHFHIEGDGDVLLDRV